jgi:uncharacterized protein
VTGFGQYTGAKENWPAPKKLVTDAVGVLSRGEVRYLENKLLDYADTTSTQIAIVVIESTGGDEINLFTAELAEQWKIGQAGKDNGCLILLAASDREISIQNGYGLEPYLTDAVSRMIIENEIIPAFKAGDYAAGLDRGTTAIMKVLAGTYEGKGGRSAKSGKRKLPMGLIIIIILAISYFRNGGGGGGGRRYRSGMGPFWWGFGSGYTMGGGHRGGGFGGSGGFGGGGFGGFGGGSFGGGGASGSW